MPRTTATNRLVVRNYDFSIENKTTNFVRGNSATFTPPFSLIIKLKTRDLSQNGTIFSLRGASDNLIWGVNFLPGDRKQFLYLSTGGGQGVASRIVVDDNFHSLCITLSGTNVNLYDNGAQDGAANQPITMSAQTSIWTLLQEPNGANPLIGIIQDFQVYDKVLSFSEIEQEHFNNIIPSGLTDRFKFIEGSGLVSTNSGDGSLTAGPTSSSMWTSESFMKSRTASATHSLASSRTLIS